MKLSGTVSTVVGSLLFASNAAAFQPTGLFHRSSRPTTITSTNLFATLTAIDVSERAQRDVRSMEEWALNYGVQKGDGVQLASSGTTNNNNDFGVMTDQPLSAGSPVVFVPNNLILSSYSAAEEFGNSLEQAEAKLSIAGLGYQIPQFRLFVKVLAEYEKGTDSPYYQWLNGLPRLYNNGAAMTYACFECLPPYVAWLSLKERSTFVNFQKALQTVPLNPDTINDVTAVKWAHNVVTTRALDWYGEKMLAPMADMFNHATDPEVEINFDDQGNCMAYAMKDMPAGSPLRVSLGDPTNPSPLLATYGFLDDTSPATFCKVMHLQKEMEALNYDFSDLLFYKDTGDISPRVWDVVLYKVLEQDEQLRKGFYDACLASDEATKQQYHQQYFSYSLEVLKKHVDDTLRELDQLQGTARGRDPSKYPRIPLILAHNEFVKSTFLKVQANLNNMG